MAKNTQAQLQKGGGVPKWMTSMNTIKASVYHAPDALARINEIRLFCPTSLYNELAELMFSIKKNNGLVFSKNNSLKDLDSFALLNKLPHKRALQWTKAIVSCFKEEIASFSRLTKEYEYSLLLGDWSRCKLLLASIEVLTGHSIWLVKNKIAFEHAAYGLAANKSILNEIIGECEEGGLVAFIAHYTSQRNEETISPNRFIEDIIEHLPKNNLGKVANDFLEYHIMPDVKSMNLDSLMNVMHFSSSMSYVDVYDSLIQCIKVAISKDIDLSIYNVKNVINELREFIDDDQLRYILVDLAMEPVGYGLNQKSMLAYEYLISGQFKEAGNKAAEILLQSPADIYALSIYVKSSMFTLLTNVFKRDAFITRIVEALRNVYLKNENLASSTTFLLRTGLNYFSNCWADYGKSTITLDTSHNPLELGAGDVRFPYVGLYPHPLKIGYSASIENRVKLYEYLILVSKYSGLNTYLNYFSDWGVKDEPSYLFEEEYKLVKIEVALFNRDYDVSLEISSQLAVSPYPVYRDAGIKVKAFSLLMLGKVQECADYVISCFLNDQKIFYILPIEEILNLIEDSSETQLMGIISIPIMYDIYIKFLKEGDEHKRAYAFEDFLDAHNYSKPSQLRESISLFDRNKLVYFLRYMCVESVMDVSTSFASSQELIDERLDVCRLLCEIDSGNEDIYQEEIKAILKSNAIKKKVRQVEQSKIYVDVTNIKLHLEASIREYFNRYMSLRNSKLNTLATLVRKAEKSYIVVTVARTEIDAIFTSMLAEMRDSYVFSAKHGLDGYLSVRIRHGTLSSQLRSIFEPFQLVTQIDSSTNEYKSNMYWVDELSVPKHREGEIISSFNKFSSGIDSAIDTVVNELIRIKKDEFDKGLFDFTINEDELNSLQLKINTYTVFGEFINIILEFFNSKLEHSLLIVRNHIDSHLKEQLALLVTQLYAQIEKLLTHNSYSYFKSKNELLNTSMQSTLSRIKEWFHLPKSATTDPFYIEEAISIGLATVESSSHLFQIQLNETDKHFEKEFNGLLLPVFVDIFCIIFKNIKSHSGFVDRNKAFIELKFKDNAVIIRVENELAEGVYNSEKEIRLKEIKSSISSDKYIASVRSEGGTGFYKVRKLFLHDFKADSNRAISNFDFGFISSSRFFVEMEVAYSNTKALIV